MENIDKKVFMDRIYKIEHETRNINLDTRDFYNGLYEFFSESYTINCVEAFNEGYKEGYKEGYGDGYEQGHDDGYEECRKLFNEYVKKIDISKLLNDDYEKWSKENEAILSRG